MSLEVSQEGKGKITLTTEVDDSLKRYIIPRTYPLVIKSENFSALMQEWRCKGFSAWYNRMWAQERAVICLDAPYPVLELRIAIKNRVKGTWEGKTEGDLPPGFFQMCFVPRVATRAIFEKKGEYQTFDIHFHLSFLKSVGVKYTSLEEFIKKVEEGKEAVELAPRAFRCTPEMEQLVQIIIRNEHSEAGLEAMLQNHIRSILIAALEQVGKGENVKLHLSKLDTDALYEIKELIKSNSPKYLSNEVLLSKVYPRLNEFKLSCGFKQLFDEPPFDYYQRCRFEKSAGLLEKGMLVKEVAYELGYESVNKFIAKFKTFFGRTPKKWMQERANIEQ